MSYQRKPHPWLWSYYITCRSHNYTLRKKRDNLKFPTQQCHLLDTCMTKATFTSVKLSTTNTTIQCWALMYWGYIETLFHLVINALALCWWEPVLSTVLGEVHFYGKQTEPCCLQEGWYLQQGLSRCKCVWVLACKCVTVDLRGYQWWALWWNTDRYPVWLCLWSMNKISAHKNELR